MKSKRKGFSAISLLIIPLLISSLLAFNCCLLYSSQATLTIEKCSHNQISFPSFGNSHAESCQKSSVFFLVNIPEKSLYPQQIEPFTLLTESDIKIIFIKKLSNEL